MINSDNIEYYENDKEFGLNFNNGINPKILIEEIDEIEKIDG